MMKLRIEDFERSTQTNPLDLFDQGIKSRETREKYTRTLRQVLCGMLEDILQGTFEQRVAQLVKQGREDPDWVQDLMLSLSRKLRERTTLAETDEQYLNPVSFGNYFKPIRKLLDMNDVLIAWQRVYATFPPEENTQSASRGWSRGEIQQMLRFSCGTFERAIVLICASSGIRVGGFEDLQWRDLVPVYRVPMIITEGEDESAKGNKKTTTRLQLGEDTNKVENAELVCAKLQIYRNSSESYPAFITPEAYRAIQDYRIQWVAQAGREPRAKDPLFIKMGDGPLRRATLPMIKKHIERLISRSGVRAQHQTKQTRRYEVPIMNGFRRFWNKTCKETESAETPLASLIKKEYMMGHTGLTKLGRNYFKSNTLELAAEYLHSVAALTIDDATRLLITSSKQRKQINELTDAKDVEIAGLKKTVEELARRMESAQR